MQPLSDPTLQEFELAALDGAKRLREFLGLEDGPKDYLQAKLAAAAISSYARLRASESNRMAIELMATRTLSVGTSQGRLTE